MAELEQLLSEDSEDDDLAPSRGLPSVLYSSGHGEQDGVVHATTSHHLRHLRHLRQTWFMKEMLMLLKLSIPAFLMKFFQQLQFSITLLFVGQFSGSLEYDAAALASSFVIVSGYSMIIGIATAAGTLCPQSYGYKNYKRVGVILQRGVLILFLFCVPIAAIWLNTDSILLWLQQLPCVVRLAGQYARIYVLALPFLVLYVMLQKYMQAQSLVWIFVAIGAFVDIATVTFSAILIVGADLGIIGAGISMVLSTALAPILLIIYIWCRKLHLQTWGGLSFESLTEWGQFLRLGIPGCLMLAFEWWTFEISTLIAGSIDKTQLAVSSIILQMVTLIFMICAGMSVAINVRVGNELGAGNPLSAKRASYVAIIMQSTGVAVMVFVLRNYIGRIFTSDEDIVTGVGDTIIGAIGVFFFDQLQGVISGIMRATGKQLSAAAVNFFSYYFIGIPVGITLALVVGLKAKGLWIGLSISGFVQTGILFIIVLRMNWKKESEKAMKTAEDGSSSPEADNTSLESQSTEEDSISDDRNQFTGEDDSFTGKDIAFSQEPQSTEVDITFPDDSLKESLETNHDSCIELRDINTERDVDDIESNPEILYGGTKQLSPQTRHVYSSSSRFCQSKSSIIISRTIILMGFLFILLAGAVLAGVYRHHPTDCDDMDVQNCSIVCQSSVVLPPEPSTISEVDITPTSVPVVRPRTISEVDIAPTSVVRPSTITDPSPAATVTKYY